MRLAAAALAVALLGIVAGYVGTNLFEAESQPSHAGPLPLTAEGRIKVLITGDGPGGAVYRECEVDASVEVSADRKVAKVVQSGQRQVKIGEDVSLEQEYYGGPLWVYRDDDGRLRSGWYRCVEVAPPSGPPVYPPRTYVPSTDTPAPLPSSPPVPVP